MTMSGFQPQRGEKHKQSRAAPRGVTVTACVAIQFVLECMLQCLATSDLYTPLAIYNSSLRVELATPDL